VHLFLGLLAWLGTLGRECVNLRRKSFIIFETL
jgi:hypothetical protein